MQTLEIPRKSVVSTKGPKVELGLVLDRSSSMAVLQDSATAAFNTLLTEQRKLKDLATASLLLFNGEHEFLISGRPLAEAPNLNRNNYQPNGSTALLDALGAMIQTIGARVDSEPINASRVLVATLTDGEENCSHNYTFGSLKEMITYRQSICGWQFILISPKPASIAFRLGIPITNALPWKSSAEAVGQTLSRLSKSVTAYRLGDSKWRVQLQG
jgi:hypothetical protein